MTVFRMILRELICDHDGCDGTDSVGGGDRDARQLRRILAAAGWTYRDGKDFCPKHNAVKEGS